MKFKYEICLCSHDRMKHNDNKLNPCNYCKCKNFIWSATAHKIFEPREKILFKK